MCIICYCVCFQNSTIITDSDQYDSLVKRQQPIKWQTNQEYTNLTNDLTSTCRNSVQGKILLIDDRGFVCSRSDLIGSTGCCNIELPNTRLYSCDTCDEKTNCCSIYEYCVSCCLNPEKVCSNYISLLNPHKVEYD